MLPLALMANTFWRGSRDRPFTGELSVGPELLQQVIPDETATSQPNSH
jgi:hypothetical protein